MKALIVRTENEAALRKLGELLRTLNFEVEQVEEKPVSVSEPFEPDLCLSWDFGRTGILRRKS